MHSVLRALARQPDPLSDAALLARYAADRDPAAFEVLVWRHGGMVLGVCRRHLRDAHAAEDAFQATFLVLSRKAGTVGGDTLPGWLHRVARRAAGRAAAKAQRRRETPLVAELPARRAADAELAAVLDAEIDRLPDRLRQVVVLCYLDGESTEAAATRLGIPRGTVLSRLHTARATLTARLTRRGVTPPVVGLTAILTAEQVAGGVRVVGGGFGPATILANEVLAMSVHRTVLVVAVGLVLAGGAGTGVLNAQNGGGPPGPTGGNQPPAVKVGTDQRAGEEADRRKEEEFREQNARLKKLEEVLKELDEKISHRRAAIERLQRATGVGSDPATTTALIAASSADLNRLSSDIYTEEAAIRTLEIAIQKHRQNSATVETMPINATELEAAINSDPLVQEQRLALTAAERRHKDADEKFDPDSPAVTRLREQLATAKAGLAKIRNTQKPPVERLIRANLKRNVEAQLRVDSDILDTRSKFLEQLKAIRRIKQEEIKALTVGGAAMKVEDDDLKPLLAQRAIFAEALVRLVIDHRLGVPLAAPPTDKLDLILTELREVRRMLEAKK